MVLLLRNFVAMADTWKILWLWRLIIAILELALKVVAHFEKRESESRAFETRAQP